MLKVFLVEDEVLIREGLRDKIPWEQYGFRLVGEAADGEVALPLIRKNASGCSDHRYQNAIYGRVGFKQDRSGGVAGDQDHYYQWL